jgi:hypothetical protein
VQTLISAIATMKFANTRVLEETMYRVIPKGWGVPEIALAVPLALQRFVISGMPWPEGILKILKLF